MLLEKAVAFFHCEAWAITFRNCWEGGPQVFAHQTQALPLGVTAQCCHPEYYYHVNTFYFPGIP